jgi:ketose-bisphosphate aldolase
LRSRGDGVAVSDAGRRADFRSQISAARATRRPLLAFNAVDLASLAGILDAARRTGRPVIVQWSARTVALYTAHSISAAFRAVLQDRDVNAYLHLDHCADEGILAAALAAGFDGIMADGSHRSFEDNLAWTHGWAARAHDEGAVIEGELGAIHGAEDGFAGAERNAAPDAESYLTFARESGVDLLGADIGTAHGVYAREPIIDFGLLEALANREAPGFVVHGCSGLSESVLGKLVAARAVKLNYSTDLKAAWAGAVAAAVNGTPTEPVAGLRSARDAIAAMAMERWRRCGAPS